MRFPFLPIAEIDHAAEMLLTRAFGAIDTLDPFVDLEELVYDWLSEMEGLIFDDENPLPTEDGEAVLGKTIARPGKILIHAPLKTERSLGRYRFTVAHEIGHWVLHRPVILADEHQLSLLSPGPSFEFVSLNRSVFPRDLSSTSLPPEEWQANRFASALLAPQVILEREFKVRYGTPPAVWKDGGATRLPSFRSFAREVAAQRVRRKPPLAEMFGLSLEAMAITLQERHLVVPD